MRYSFKIASVWGIPIELHVTFILLIIFVFLLTSWQYTVLVIFLFAFVVTHELSHSAVARHYKIGVRKIVLYPIGGVSEIEEIPDNPRIEWRMAAAGPLMSLLVGGLLFAVYYFFPVPLEGIFSGSLTHDLALLNVLLGLFNFVPAFPMDGGRVL